MAGRPDQGRAAALLKLAEEHTDTAMPGFTHLRSRSRSHAHHLMAYFEMLMRDAQRLADCRNASTGCR
jgi:argininosuccinate lyase